MVICVSRLRLESYSSTLSDPRYRFDPTPLAIGTRVALRIEYLGTSYCGWQAQPHLPVATVQECLEQALGKVADQPVTTHCAGRTDTGVHGFAQIAHFDDPVGRSGKAWVMGANCPQISGYIGRIRSIRVFTLATVPWLGVIAMSLPIPLCALRIWPLWSRGSAGPLRWRRCLRLLRRW